MLINFCFHSINSLEFAFLIYLDTYIELTKLKIK